LWKDHLIPWVIDSQNNGFSGSMGNILGFSSRIFFFTLSFHPSQPCLP